MTSEKTEVLAKDVMTADPLCVPPSMTLRELVRTFEENEISGVPVTDSQGRVVGIVTKSDVLRRFSKGTDELPPAYLFEILSEVADEEVSDDLHEPRFCVDDVMTEDPIMVPPTMPVGQVAREMFESRVHRVVVANAEKYPLGIITSMDMLGVFPK
ncbi:MAG: CBS domain-containing protein [Phycisphaerae bacterium]|nr:Inosine-5'-monophosphate dehydrogenase [Phycisphaerales bacterium]MCK6476268.1 CBS domain-containing protein [Phycisphaerales bacterium]